MKKRKNTIIKTFNAFKGTNSEILNTFYSKKILFQDPVTTVKGLENLKKYYAHAYKNVQTIQFDFDEFFFDGANVLATWKMQVKAKGLNSGKKFSLPGISKFKFDQ